MIKQIPSKEIKDYMKNNPKSVLLDVRTKEEWDQIGKPDGDKIGLKTYFLSLQFEGKILLDSGKTYYSSRIGSKFSFKFS